MTWNVYVYDMNKRKIRLHNVFDHWRFNDEVQKMLADKKLTEEKFKTDLRSSLVYYYWSKAEWEVILTPFSSNPSDEKKIDVYDQVMNNWDIFCNYVWSFRKESK